MSSPQYGVLRRGVVVRPGVATGTYVVEIPSLAQGRAWGPVESTVPDLATGERVVLAQIGSTRDDVVIVGRIAEDAKAAAWSSRGVTVLDPAAVNVMVWRAPTACRLQRVLGLRVGGSGATVNARRNGASTHMVSDLSLSITGGWLDGGAVRDTDYAAGDTLEIMITAVTGSPAQVAVQVDFRSP